MLAYTTDRLALRKLNKTRIGAGPGGKVTEAKRNDGETKLTIDIMACETRPDTRNYENVRSGARGHSHGYEPESFGKNHAFQNERARTLGSGAAGERRTGTLDLGSRSLRAGAEPDRPDAAERAERTEWADGGRAGGARGPDGAGRAVCNGMRDGRRRGVSWMRASSSSCSSGMCSGSMSRMLEWASRALQCASRALQCRLVGDTERVGDAERAGLRRLPSSCRTRARAPSNSMLFSSNCEKCV